MRPRGRHASPISARSGSEEAASSSKASINCPERAIPAQFVGGPDGCSIGRTVHGLRRKLLSWMPSHGLRPQAMSLPLAIAVH